ncbi:MAG: immunoglobulin domain-containing protein [Bacteroidetes bacterium]|nr:immunoglobulin domain-containing protein [Bacteroidota bacterium]
MEKITYSVFGGLFIALFGILNQTIATNPPTFLYVGYPSAQSGSANPTNFNYSTPFFSAINNNGEAATKYLIELTLASDVSFASPIWNSGSVNMTSTADGARCPDIFYGGSTLLQPGTNYIWKIHFYGTTNGWGLGPTVPATIGMATGALTARFYSGVGNGYANDWGYSTWDGAHDALSGIGIGQEDLFKAYSHKADQGFYFIRSFFPFYTAYLPDDATYISATFNAYITGKINSDNDGDDWINIIGQTTQASFSALEVSDFDQCGAVNNPTEGATRIDIGNILINDWKVWTLNPTGLSWISKTGYTALGMREGHDCIDSPIVGSGEYSSGIDGRSSYYTGITYDPYLSVTYTIPCTAPTISTHPTSPASICSGGSANITGLVAAGTATLSYQWKYNSADVSDGTPAGATYTNQTTVTMTVSGITGAGSYQYSCYVSNGCGNITSNTATVTVHPIFTAGSILTTGETINNNGNPGLIGSSTVASGGDETISYQWQISTTSSSTGFGDISGATSASYDPPSGLTATTWYRRQAKDGACNTSFTASSGVWLVMVATPATVDWNNSNVQEITLAADRSLIFANGKSGGVYTFIIKQDATGGKTIIWPTDVKWVDSSTPTLSPTGNTVDIIKFVYDGINYFETGRALNIH